MTPSWSSSRRCDDELGPLDTSTVILLGRIKDPATLPDESVISVITLAELSVGPHVADTEAERIARQVHLQHAENVFDVIAFDAVRPVLSARRPALYEPLVASRRLGLTMP